MRSLRYVHFVPAVLLLTACPSLSTLHTARPIEAGHIEIAASGGPYGVPFSAGGVSTVIIWPTFELGFRYGANEMFDFGLKLTTGLVMQADFNFAPIVSDNFVLSIDPTVAISFIAGGGATVVLLYLWAPVLFDVVNLDFMTLTLGVKPGVAIVTGNLGTGGTNVGFAGTSGLLGGSAGIKFKLTESFSLMPEFVVIVPLAPGSSGFLFEGQLGFLIEF